MSEKSTGKRKIKKIILLSVIFVVLAVVIGVFAYVSDYYSATDNALAAMSSTQSYNVEVTDFGIVYKPASVRAGLIFYQGGKVDHTAYAPLMARLAQEDILCVLIEMPLRLAVLNMNAADGIIQKFPEVNEWYIGGHSLGGAMAASYVAEHTEEYKGLVLLGAYSTVDLSNSGLKVISIYGSEDKVINMQAYEENKSNLPENFTQLVIDGGCHSYFGDYGTQEGDGAATITQKEQLEITAESISEWLK